MCGIPVIATDIGALGERMRELNCGWIVSVEHAYEETMDILGRIKEKGPEYQEKFAWVQALKVKTLEDMRKEYLRIYHSLHTKHVRFLNITSDQKRWVLHHYLWGPNTKIPIGDLEDLVEQIHSLELQLQIINTSFEYKCARALLQIPCVKKSVLTLYSIFLRYKRK